jgi:DNA ligase D-like protein (predicted 3'-phosphoesterase)
MPLTEYGKKRDFAKTPEPARPAAKKKTGLVYVIQKHDASRLHYDLRLETDGVLKSWALPKEPPNEPGVKRLAVPTEDHPLGYESFEGVIPEPEYGAGRVEIWDSGEYVPLESGPDRLVIEVKGRRLKGRFVLVRIKNRDPKGGFVWLFFKAGGSETNKGPGKKAPGGKS